MDWNTINKKYVHPAREAWQAGDHDKAEALFREGLAVTHQDGYVALRFAEFLEDVKRLDEARSLFEIALRKLPKKEYQLKAKEGLERTSSAVPTIDVPVSSPTVTSLGGRSGRIGLLSCTKYKKNYVCTARDLYSESENFRTHLAFAERHYTRTFVVSAKHGLLELHQLLAPYDASLDDYDVEERDVWARFIAARLHLEGVGDAHTAFIHASHKYGVPLRDALMRYRIRSKIIDFERTPSEEELRIEPQPHDA